MGVFSCGRTLSQGFTTGCHYGSELLHTTWVDYHDQHLPFTIDSPLMSAVPLTLAFAIFSVLWKWYHFSTHCLLLPCFWLDHCFKSLLIPADHAICIKTRPNGRSFAWLSFALLPPRMTYLQAVWLHSQHALAWLYIISLNFVTCLEKLFCTIMFDFRHFVAEKCFYVLRTFLVTADTRARNQPSN